jgi:hypothetical protein
VKRLWTHIKKCPGDKIKHLDSERSLHTKPLGALGYVKKIYKFGGSVGARDFEQEKVVIGIKSIK